MVLCNEKSLIRNQPQLPNIRLFVLVLINRQLNGISIVLSVKDPMVYVFSFSVMQ